MVDRSQLSRMIDNMEKDFDSMEARQKERHDAEDRNVAKDCEYDIVNPLITPPNPPCFGYATCADTWAGKAIIVLMPTSTPQEELELQAALAEQVALLDRYFAITPPQLGASEARLWATSL